MQSLKLARALNGRLLGEDVDLLQVAPIFMAGPKSLSAILWPKDVGLAKKTKAQVLLVDLATAAEYADEIPATLIVIDNFHEAFLKLKEIFSKPTQKIGVDGAKVHASAQVGQAFVGAGTIIGPHVVVADGAVIGKNCLIEAGVVIGPQVYIGENTVIKANSVIGSEGFVPFGQEAKNLNCLASVIIEADCRIGALCSIDRGLLGDTTIKKGSLLDNMVHIGHDSIVGKNCIIAGQSGLSGNVRLGDFVTMGGQSGIVPHVVVGDGARISGKSLVHCDIKSQEIWSGNPSMPHGIYLRSYAKLRREFREK